MTKLVEQLWWDLGILDKNTNSGIEENSIIEWHVGNKPYRTWWWIKNGDRESLYEWFINPCLVKSDDHLCCSAGHWSLSINSSLLEKIKALFIYTFMPKCLLSTVYQKLLYMIFLKEQDSYSNRVIFRFNYSPLFSKKMSFKPMIK